MKDIAKHFLKKYPNVFKGVYTKEPYVYLITNDDGRISDYMYSKVELFDESIQKYIRRRKYIIHKIKEDTDENKSKVQIGTSIFKVTYASWVHPSYVLSKVYFYTRNAIYITLPSDLYEYKHLNIPKLLNHTKKSLGFSDIKIRDTKPNRLSYATDIEFDPDGIFKPIDWYIPSFKDYLLYVHKNGIM